MLIKHKYIFNVAKYFLLINEKMYLASSYPSFATNIHNFIILNNITTLLILNVPALWTRGLGRFLELLLPDAELV